MAKTKINLQDLSVEELHERTEENVVLLRKMRFNHTISPLDNTNVLKNIRRDIARLKTEVRARELSK